MAPTPAEDFFSGLFGLLMLLVLVVVAGFFYFLPSIAGRHKRNASAIFVLNLCLGWTFIGWVVALVWAVTQDRE